MSTSRSCNWTWRWSERCARWSSRRRTTLAVAAAARPTRKRTRSCNWREQKGSASPSCWRWNLLPSRQESIPLAAGETAWTRASSRWQQRRRQHRSCTSSRSLPLGLLQLLRVLRQWWKGWRSSRVILPWTSPRWSSDVSDVLRKGSWSYLDQTPSRSWWTRH